MRTAINPLSRGGFMAGKETESWHRDGPAHTNFIALAPPIYLPPQSCHPWKPKTFPSSCHSTNSCRRARINLSFCGDTSCVLSGTDPCLGNRALEAPLHTSCSDSLSLADSSQSQQWLAGLHSHLTWGIRSSLGSGLTSWRCVRHTPPALTLKAGPACNPESELSAGCHVRVSSSPATHSTRRSHHKSLLQVKEGHQYPPQNGRTVNERNGEWNLLLSSNHAQLILTQPTRNNHCYPHFRD